MIQNPISMDTVYGRYLCMIDSRQSLHTDNGTVHKSLSKLQESGKDHVKMRDALNEIFNVCYGSKESANKYALDFVTAMKYIKESGDQDLFNTARSMMEDRLLPYLEQSTIDQVVNDYESSFDKPVVDQLKEEASRIKVADRIYDNHQKLSKRFNINTVVKKYSTIDEICRSVCKMVDTYNIKPKTKMAICIEEVVYLMDSNNRKYRDADIVESVTDYFLGINTIPIICEEVIQESKVIGKKANKKVAYLSKPYKSNKDLVEEMSLDSILESEDDINNLINQYKADTAKTDSKFKQVLIKIFTKSPKNIIDDTPDIFKFIRGFLVLLTTSKNLIAGAVSYLVNGFIGLKMEKEEIKRVIRYFENERDKADDMALRADDEDEANNLKEYVKELDKAIEKLNNYRNSLYSANQDIDFDEDEDDDDKDKDDDDEDFFGEGYCEISDTGKCKVVMQNLIQDSIECDQMITKISKDTFKKHNVEKTDIKDNPKFETIFDHINENSRISFVFSSYNTSKCEDKAALQEIVYNITNAVNSARYIKESSCNYIFMENSVDFILESKYRILTNLAEDTKVGSSLTDTMAYRSAFIIETANKFDKLLGYHPESLVDAAISKIGSLSPEMVNMFIEAWSYSGIIDRDEMNRFINEYATYQHEMSDYIEEYTVKSNFENTEAVKNPTMNEILESTEIMCDIVNEAVDLNSLKLSLMGAKNKLKTLGAKEKELSRDLDVSFNNLIKGLSGCDNTARREQIIKGQVCPSLSKILKIGILLAGMGVATHNFVIPAITAVAGLAISKNAKDRERKYILDEIDVELKVVEREINNLDSNGKSGAKNAKKYRTLLTYQKNLERERQRIVYGLARKGKRIPVSSTAGFKGED